MVVSGRRKVLLVVGAAVAAVGVTSILGRRADLTDPAEIAKLPPNDRREVETERLIRAAFLNAKSIFIL